MIRKRIKLIMILPHLKAGGAERVVSFLFRKLDRSIYEPYLLVIGFENEAHYKLEDKNVIYLNKKKLRLALFSIIKKIIKINPSLVFSSIGHINIYLGFLKPFFPKIKFVAREASVYNKMMSFNDKKQLPKIVLKKLYQNLDALVYQSLDMKNDFEKTFKVNTTKGYLIHNPITFPLKEVKVTKYKRTSVLKFIIVGSLVRNKGHERVLKLLEKVKFDFILEIVGEGPLKDYLKEFLVQTSIEDKVFFRGLQDKMEIIYENSDFLIQGSYVEGFPNVVLEALSFGIPCIIFDAPGGHRELINESKNGFFIYDCDNPSSVFEEAINHSWDRNEIQKDAYNRFDSYKILNEYEIMFQNILKI